MTEQVLDTVILDGEHLDWAKSPYLPESHPLFIKVGDEFENYSTSCWRGYEAAWEIRDNKLYLARIDGVYKIVGEEPLFAEWVSGTASIGYEYDWNNDPMFQRLPYIEVEQGIVIGKREERCTDTPRSVAEAEALLAEGADINEWVDKQNKTMLYSAVSNNRPEILEYLLKKGAHVTEDMLSLAVELGHQSVVEVFLAAAVNAKAVASHLLHHTAHYGNLDLTMLVLANGADVNSTVLEDGKTPLFRAAGRGHQDIVQLLIACGADTNARDEDDKTPLQAAIWHQDKQTIEMLVENGASAADFNIRDDRGRTFLHIFATNSKYVDFADYLITKGLDVNDANKNGVTPLHVAAFGVKPMVQLLLAHGAEVNVSDKDGETPLHIAAQWGYREIAEMMLALGADAQAKTHDGKTPLDCAIENKHEKVVELLRQHEGK